MTWADLARAAWRFDPAHHLVHQLALIQRYLPIAMPASALVAVLVAVVHQHFTHDPAIWGWAGVAVTISAAGLLLSRRVPGPLDEAETTVVSRRLRALALGLGMTWAALPWLFMLTPQAHTTNLVLGVLAGLSSGGVVLFSPALPLSVIYLLGTIPSAAIVLLGSAHAPDQVMGLCVLIYFVTMLGFCVQSSRAVRESIELRLANTELVVRLRDQTDRAFAARQLAEEALQEAEAANRAKVVFLAAASHDLRQPLHALGLFTQTLSATALTSRQQALLAQIDASADAARDMLGTLLDFSRVEAGVITPRPQPMALQTVLQRLVREFAPQAAAKGLMCRLHDTHAVVCADAHLVERIMRNLMSNALRYTERGGVLVGCRRRGDRAVVEVWDTGVGIPRHEQQAIFQEFHQLGNPERDRRKGLGLGLAIVQGLARAMSVSVTVSSVAGRGSVFRLTLPLSREAVLPPTDPMPLQADLAGARVLVIDDDESVRAAMADLLTSWGAWVEVVESLPEALSVLARFTPQVVVTDHRLRGPVTGRDALELVRRHVGRAVPGVLVTGDTAADRLRDAQSSGAVLLHKPVPAAQLHAVLADLLLVERLSERPAWAGGGPQGGPAAPAD